MSCHLGTGEVDLVNVLLDSETQAAEVAGDGLSGSVELEVGIDVGYAAVAAKRGGQTDHADLF